MSRINIWIALLLVSVLVNGVLIGAGAHRWLSDDGAARTSNPEISRPAAAAAWAIRPLGPTRTGRIRPRSAASTAPVSESSSTG